MPDSGDTFTPDLTADDLRRTGVYDQLLGSGKGRLASLAAWPAAWKAGPGGVRGGEPWLDWYEHYSGGRRMPARDASQIARWRSFKARHGAALAANPTPRRAFALRNWAVDPLSLVGDADRPKLEQAMAEYEARVRQRAKTAAEAAPLQGVKAAIKAVLGKYDGDGLDGLRVAVHPAGPVVWADLMDWHDGKAGNEALKAAARELGVEVRDVGSAARVQMGRPGVYAFNEGPKPPGPGWQDLVPGRNKSAQAAAAGTLLARVLAGETAAVKTANPAALLRGAAQAGARAVAPAARGLPAAAMRPIPRAPGAVVQRVDPRAIGPAGVRGDAASGAFNANAVRMTGRPGAVTPRPPAETAAQAAARNTGRPLIEGTARRNSFTGALHPYGIARANEGPGGTLATTLSQSMAGASGPVAQAIARSRYAPPPPSLLSRVVGGTAGDAGAGVQAVGRAGLSGLTAAGRGVGRAAADREVLTSLGAAAPALGMVGGGVAVHQGWRPFGQPTGGEAVVKQSSFGAAAGQFAQDQPPALEARLRAGLGRGDDRDPSADPFAHPLTGGLAGAAVGGLLAGGHRFVANRLKKKQDRGSLLNAVLFGAAAGGGLGATAGSLNPASDRHARFAADRGQLAKQRGSAFADQAADPLGSAGGGSGAALLAKG